MHKANSLPAKRWAYNSIRRKSAALFSGVQLFIMAAFLLQLHRELDDEELEDYMIEYHPYYSGRNPNHTQGSDSQTLVYLKSGKLQERDPDRFYALANALRNGY